MQLSGICAYLAHMMPSAAQCRAARALLNVHREWLAKRSGVSPRALGNFETELTTPIPNNLAAIRQALEEAGVEFTEDDGVKRRPNPKKPPRANEPGVISASGRGADADGV